MLCIHINICIISIIAAKAIILLLCAMLNASWCRKCYTPHLYEVKARNISNQYISLFYNMFSKHAFSENVLQCQIYSFFALTCG